VSLTIHIEQFSWAVLPYCEYVQRVSHNLFSFVAFKTYLSPVYAVKRRYCPSLVYIENRPVYTLVLNSYTLLRSFSRNYSQTAWGTFFFLKNWIAVFLFWMLNVVFHEVTFVLVGALQCKPKISTCRILFTGSFVIFTYMQWGPNRLV